jgi:glutamate racemase
VALSIRNHYFGRDEALQRYMRVPPDGGIAGHFKNNDDDAKTMTLPPAIRTSIQSFAASILLIGCAPSGDTSMTELRNAIDKEAVTLLVTDSGLGGLAVCADIVEKAKEQKQYGVLHVVFCDALPEANAGYNKMRTTERKAQVFSDALDGMVQRYHPNAVLIACNTLSVVYPETRFHRSRSIPVVGIVDIGVDLLMQQLSEHRTAGAIIFGTETTIRSNAHKSRLLEYGIAPDRIVTQACPGLAGEIETDARSDRVRTSIELFADDALKRLPGTMDTVLAGLCCTHYGYCGGMFASALRSRSGRAVEIVDPTRSMSELVFVPGRRDRFPQTSVTVSVVSRAVISPAEIKSIAGLLDDSSPETATALRNYELRRDLFPYVEE